MATIIKYIEPNEDPTAQAVRPVAFSFDDMGNRADAYLETVRSEAAKIIQQAHQDAKQIRQKAEEAGRQAAQNAIERILDERIEKQMATLRPAIKKVITEMTLARSTWQQRWEKNVIQIVMAVAEKVIHREVQATPEITLEWIAESLQLAAGSADITIYLNEEDHKNLGSQAENLIAIMADLAPTALVADPTVTPGGCRVRTEFGEIDQQIETQIRRLTEELS